MKITIIGVILLSMLAISLLLGVNFVYSAWSSPGIYFNVTPSMLYLNWSNSPSAYMSNLSLATNQSFNLTLEVMNSTGFSANYSQPYGGNDLSVCQPIASVIINVVNVTSLNAVLNMISGTPGLVYQTNITVSGNRPECRPGRYYKNLMIRNFTSSTENLNVTVFLDLPISISNNPNLVVNGNATFAGSLPINATTYHSYYFNTSEVANATGIAINLTGWSSSQDIDLFLFDNSGNLLDKSINKNSTEYLSYNYLSPAVVWELRVYGNSTSTIPYTGYLLFTTLNVTNRSATNQTISSIDFGVMNTSSTKQVNLTLKNEGNFTLSGVEESKELYYVRTFSDSGNKNFTFLVPGSSIATKVKVALNWTGGTNYSFNLYNSNDTLIVNSFNKYQYANISNSMEEEYNETTDITDIGYWKVEVKNNTINYTDTYTVTAYVYVDPTNWFASNFSSSGTDLSGNSNYTSQINLTIPNASLSGLYQGNFRYMDTRGGQIKIPITINVTAPTLIVTNDNSNPIPFSVLSSGTFRVDENYGANLTRSLGFKLNNTGFYDMVITSTNSSVLTCSSGDCTDYTLNFTYNVTNGTVISKNSYKSLQVNITLNSSHPTGVYDGSIVFNATNSTPALSSHPYQTFTLNIKLNLTDLIYLNVSDIVAVGGNNILQNIAGGELVMVKVNVNYVNKTASITTLNTSDFISVWLQEGNVSGSTGREPVTGSLTISNGTNPIWDGSRYNINMTVPAYVPGGQYKVHVIATYNRSDSKNFDGEGVANSSLIINNTGLYMNTSDTISSVTVGSDVYYDVDVRNFGPLAASSEKIEFNDSGCPYITVTTDEYGPLTTCSATGSGDTFTFNMPAYNSSGCWFRWKIHGDINGTCYSGNYPLIVNGTNVGANIKWFNNITGLAITVNAVTTTTTAAVPTNLPAPTTTTIRSNATTTTTTTIPTTTPKNETVGVVLITPQVPAIFNISGSNVLKIQNVILAVNKNVTNVQIMVKEASHPAGAPNVTDYETGIIFKYLDISMTNVTGNDISNATINFQVEKDWINSSKIDSGTIALYRYFNSTWNKLQTKKLNETSTSINFQAVSPGLSVFVIAGQKAGGWDIFKMLNIFPGIPSWAIIAAIVAAVAIVLAYFFWPVKEVKTQTVYMPKDEKQEEDVISKLKEKWEKVAKKK